VRYLKSILIFAAIVSISSCASLYNVINPLNQEYFSLDESEGVTLEYKFDVLQKKYAKKEDHQSIRLVAMKVVNNSKKDLTFGNDLKLKLEDGTQIVAQENEEIFKSLKQATVSYLLYFLLSPIEFSGQFANGTRFNARIGSFAGFILATGNILTASIANQQFKKELQKNNLTGKLIKKGETVYGVVGIKTSSKIVLRVKVE